ncbi:amidase signature domain-containing protein [Xylariales sp. PMI_506]|nr:amidase signature domain-containing protein [Xylariales sp. PMI_506]
MDDHEPAVLAFTAAKPYSYTYMPTKTALVLIDIQRDFVDPDGFGAIQCGDTEIFSSVRSIVQTSQAALRASRQLGLHIFHTREGHVPDLSDLSAAKRDSQINAPNGHHTLGIGEKGPMGRLLVRGEYGHDIVDELKPLPGEVVIDKSGKGSFWATDFHRRLMARGITHLIFCGVTTECCVTTTAREANDRGFQCCILTDCTGGFESNFIKTSLDMIAAYDGLFGFTAQSAELIEEAWKASKPLTPHDTPPIWDDKSLDITTLLSTFREQGLTPTQVVEVVYRRIEDYQKKDQSVWIHLRPKAEVLGDAAALEVKYSGQNPECLPVLYGIPFAVKDNFDVAGIETTAACPAYAYVPNTTSPSVRLLLDEGALLIGKTNMDQLATGLSGCRSPYGTPASVFGDGKYISGGSSSGSGVAVAAGLVSFSLGTDTAGSGRVPAALNGIVGYKPTKGTLSARGVVPACRSLDTVSIFATSVEDARKVWYVLDVFDEEDTYAKPPASLPLALADYRPLHGSGFIFAVPPASALEMLWPAYRSEFQSVIFRLQSLGGQLQQLSEEQYRPFRTATKLLYNGTLVTERIACIDPVFVQENLDQLHPTTKTLFEAVLRRESKPWDVFSDQLAQAEASREAARLFSEHQGKVDVLVTPTVPSHPMIVEMEAEPIAANAMMGEFTHFGNVLDLCSISVNAGLASNGMPFGVSLVCAGGLDGKMFDLAEAFEHIKQHI